MAFTTFESIEAWQDARKLMRMIRVFQNRAKEQYDWEWVSQISKSCLSIMANIAEGNDSLSDAEFSRFLGYAKRSSAETRSHLYYGLDHGYCAPQEFKSAEDLSRKIASGLYRLIQHLNNGRNRMG
jgi:four helix bundle protein